MIYIAINRITQHRDESDSFWGLLGGKWTGGMMTEWMHRTKTKRKDCYATKTLFWKDQIIDIYQADHPDALAFLKPKIQLGRVTLQRLQNPNSKTYVKVTDTAIQFTDQASNAGVQSKRNNRRSSKSKIPKASKRKARRNPMPPNKANRPKGNNRILKKANPHS